MIANSDLIKDVASSDLINDVANHIWKKEVEMSAIASAVGAKVRMILKDDPHRKVACVDDIEETLQVIIKKLRDDLAKDVSYMLKDRKEE